MKTEEAIMKIEKEITSIKKLCAETENELKGNELAVFLKDNIDSVVDFITAPDDKKIELFDMQNKKKRILITSGALKTLEETKTLLKNIEPVFAQMQNVTEEQLLDKTDLLYVTNYLRMM